MRTKLDSRKGSIAMAFVVPFRYLVSGHQHEKSKDPKTGDQPYLYKVQEFLEWLPAPDL